MYYEAFLAALARNQRLGLSDFLPPAKSAMQQQWLTSQAVEELPYIIHYALGPLNAAQLSAQCIALHYRLAPVVKRWLRCEVYYTVGWVDFEAGGHYFYCDEAYLQQLLTKGTPDPKVKLHAWLTLPSMEIIDITFSTTLAKGDFAADLSLNVLARRADALVGMAYRPMLLGADFLYRAGFVQAH
ncbi:hypothetical protein E4631_19785 [Hymenobacter sp. UV11]|jgi:hypothetical protein|uniref:hypothetical protein n=1 Tax=Hymenobacter sp. UV11 TaxID=1849735 RepID=UPI0010602679|nr:hypothetical protein [Hymenobacter sp. UV11]TDN36996.1 hypothetical protein A8B98_06285 [Hymenobacter sp. UV11]TFZ64245.1 hypothetical protein E4631_19785 [Hymenobacter sp. UV11]